MSTAAEYGTVERPTREPERPVTARGWYRHEGRAAGELRYDPTGKAWREAFDARHGDPLASQEPAQEREAA